MNDGMMAGFVCGSVRLVPARFLVVSCISYPLAIIYVLDECGLAHARKVGFKKGRSGGRYNRVVTKDERY